MTACDSTIPAHASKVLSGKRVALVGFDPGSAADFASRIMDAEAFTRFIVPDQVAPSSPVLKPFELILLNAPGAAGTAWIDPTEMAHLAQRCIVIGDVAHLFSLAADPACEWGHYASSAVTPDELLFRCFLVLRSAAQKTVRQAPTNSTVVLADDDTSVTSLVRRVLERNGLNCEIAADGQQALTLITSLKPCAAVLDVHMPAMDGFELLSRIKNAGQLLATRVILLTGSEQESDVIKGFSLGASDYVCKPFSPMELTIRLMRALGRI